uniref:HTH_48 domain-containing protein n=1 Tax=Haemonchus placei TaxID=6290 RepID=A0A158QK78_HAEPC
LTSEEYFEAASEISRLHLKRSWSCDNMAKDEASDLHFGRPNGSALEIRFSNRLTFGLIGDRTDKHECPLKQLRERVAMDLKEGNGCTALYWLRGWKTFRDSSIPRWRGFSRGKFSGRSSQYIPKPKTLKQRQESIQQDSQDHTDNREQTETTRKKDPKQIRVHSSRTHRSLHGLTKYAQLRRNCQI